MTAVCIRGNLDTQTYQGYVHTEGRPKTQKDGAVSKPRRGASEESSPAGTSILDV